MSYLKFERVLERGRERSQGELPKKICTDVTIVRLFTVIVVGGRRTSGEDFIRVSVEHLFQGQTGGAAAGVAVQRTMYLIKQNRCCE
jgi:hypothetical protein